jgi:hypothetical protein
LFSRSIEVLIILFPAESFDKDRVPLMEAGQEGAMSLHSPYWLAY